MIRAFVALPIPPEVRSALTVAQFLLPLPRAVPPENFHITLSFLGDCDDWLLDEVHLALSALRATALSLQIEGFGMFGRQSTRSFHARVAGDGLDALHAKVQRACVQAGAKPEAHHFHPHVTLGRFGPDLADALRLERAVAEGAGFRAGPWLADRVVLMRSTLAPSGARYDALAEYPLTGGRGAPILAG